ncbi:general secretion pathway protein N [Hyphomonas neptunium ATCC 15444]|uniref:Type II secretion system protein N n=3 Tax=Hyphomonadaceae TaxID=69657 RepID=Q0C117_HYPNA|nr:general secretion pathway protein N [Hyphomonas neptunium ATCC 15444]KCZ95009.1 general secretion pathway protein N [Hyphomonas hirschiana VP5]
MRFLLLLVLIAGFVIGVVAFAPLSFILKTSGAEARGLSWTSAEGTLMGGRITGLRAGQDVLGDATLKLNPVSLLALGIEYDFDWAGPSGKGTGKAAAYATGTTELRDFNIELDFAALDGVAAWIRQSGGKARLTGDIIRFRKGACDKANGQAWSDALGKNAAVLGPGWPDMAGELSCDGDALLIPFKSANPSGTQLDATARFNIDGNGNLEARVSGVIPQQYQYGLPIAGFVPDGNTYVYRYPALPREVPR